MENIKEISAELIDDPINPMRSGLDRDGIDELAESIKKQGLINPITVRPKGERFEVVAGHRRFAACIQARVLRIACVVRELTDEEVFGIMAAENLERQDVDPVDEAIFLGRLVHNLNWTIEQAAEKLNRSAAWVNDRLAILDYPDYMIEIVRDGRLKLGVAKWLAQIEDDVYRKMYVESAVNHGMSVRQAEYIFRQYEMGLLIPSDKIEAVASEAPVGSVVRARAICARCGKLAEDPNLKNVFIHVECPEE